MANTNFTISSGTYNTEQELGLELDYFLTESISGWSKVKEIANSPTDLNIAYFSDGSSIGFFDRLYVRIQAITDVLSFNVLSFFDDVTDTDFDKIGGTSNQTEVLASTSSGTYWFIGNTDAVHVVVNSSLGPLHGGFGFWETYYPRLEDPKPFYVFGQTAQSQTFESALRLESYGPRSWGKSMSVTASGVGRAYSAAHPTAISQGALNPRSGEPKFIEPIFYTVDSFPSYEIRGEVPGLYMCGGAPYIHGNIVTVTGTPGTVVGDYFIHKHTDIISWAIGPLVLTVTGTNPLLF